MLRACMGSAVVLVVPGAAVASLLRLRLCSLTTWAAIPAFSIATVFVIAEVVDLVGVPFNVASVSAGVIVLMGLALVRRREPRGAGTFDDARCPRAGPAEAAVARRIALGMLVLAMAVGILICFRGVDG